MRDTLGLLEGGKHPVLGNNRKENGSFSESLSLIEDQRWGEGGERVREEEEVTEGSG